MAEQVNITTAGSDHDLLIRIDTKLDVYASVQSQQDAQLKAHDVKFAEHDAKHAAHETRFVQQDARIDKAVTPKQLWLGFVSVAGAAATVTGFIGWFINGR